MDAPRQTVNGDAPQGATKNFIYCTITGKSVAEV